MFCKLYRWAKVIARHYMTKVSQLGLIRGRIGVDNAIDRKSYTHVVEFLGYDHLIKSDDPRANYDRT